MADANCFENALYDRAVAFVLKYRDTSCSGLQRNLRIGYTLALQLKERMAANGIGSDFVTRASPDIVTIKVIEIIDANYYALRTWKGSTFSWPERITGNLENALHDTHIVFIIADSTNEAQCSEAFMIAQTAKEQGAVSVLALDVPPALEPTSQSAINLRSIAATPCADALFVIPYAKQCGSVGLTGEITRSQIALDWIRRLISPMVTQRLISVDFNDFCLTLIGTHKNKSRAIKSIQVHVNGADRSTQAMTNVLADPLFQEHLRRAEGVLFSLTVHPKYLMNRELKEISNAIQNHAADCCVISCSINYDHELPCDALIVEIFASCES